MLISRDLRLLELNGARFWRLCFFEVSEANIQFSCDILVFQIAPYFLNYDRRLKRCPFWEVMFFEVSGTKIQFFDLFFNWTLFFVLQERDEILFRVLIFPRSAPPKIFEGWTPYSSLFRGMNIILTQEIDDET